jgi:hypothetical protein
MVFFLLTINTNNNKLSVLVAQGVIDPPLESEIVIGIDLGHENILSISNISHLEAVINDTFVAEGLQIIEDELTSTELSDLDVLIILAPTSSYSDSEVDVVETFVKNGKSLFIAVGYRNQTTETSNDLLEPFGIKFEVNQSFQATLAARNFTTPIMPATENISQLLYINGLGISFNETKLQTYQAPNIDYYSPILLNNSDKPSLANNTLASTIEFENGARILAIGSSDMFNNSYVEPINNTDLGFLDNTKFALNALKWLGRNTGIMNFYDPWVNLDDVRTSIGATVYGNVTLVDSQNRTISQAQINIALERDGKILNSRSMQVDSTNSSNYFGWVSTEDLMYGWTDIIFEAQRRGYLSVELSAGRIYLEPQFPTPIPPDLAIWGLLLTVAAIFSSTAIIIRMNLAKTD